MLDRAALEAALLLTGSDLDDNLQIACAVKAGAEAIVTRDPRGFSGGPLPILAPADLLSELKTTEFTKKEG